MVLNQDFTGAASHASNFWARGPESLGRRWRFCGVLARQGGPFSLRPLPVAVDQDQAAVAWRSTGEVDAVAIERRHRAEGLMAGGAVAAGVASPGLAAALAGEAGRLGVFVGLALGLPLLRCEGWRSGLWLDQCLSRASTARCQGNTGRWWRPWRGWLQVHDVADQELGDASLNPDSDRLVNCLH